MYIPKIFKNENINDVKEFIQQNSFGILIGQVEKRIQATHIPFMLSKNDVGADVLSGHISKANPQLKDIANCNEVLVIFQGAHSYISASWYNHENVPTWNYVAVHVYGRIKIIEGDELLNSLKQLVDKHEASSKIPVSVDGMSKDFVQKEMKGIIGFEITIDSIEAAKKLSQNRDDANYKNIIHQLEKKDDENSNQIAQKMKKDREI